MDSKCAQCGTPLTKRAMQKSQKFCNRECSSLAKIKRHAGPCDWCGTETINPKFCSKSCSANFNNRREDVRRRKLEGSCRECQAPCKSTRTFCSRDCKLKNFASKSVGVRMSDGSRRPPRSTAVRQSKEIVKVFGPYRYAEEARPSMAGRAYLNVIYNDGSHGSILYSRYLAEQHLGRVLETWEHVDHIDQDHTNDNLDNLQVLTASEHAAKTARCVKPVTMIERVCPRCDTTFTRPERYFRSKKDSRRAFCSKSCSAIFNGNLRKNMHLNA